MWHLEAFAMLGALAWQAATVIKMVLVSRGEIARGLFCFSPGVSPPSCPGVLLCLHLSSDPIFLAQRSTVANRSRCYKPKVQSIIYSWSIHKLETNFRSRKLYSVLSLFTQEFVITRTHLSYSEIVCLIRSWIYYHITAQIWTKLTIGSLNKDQIV